MADNITLGSGIAAHPLDLVQSPRPNWPGDVTLPRVYPVYSSSALGYQYTAPAVYENHWQWTTAPPWIPAINQHGNATDEEADVEDEGDSDSSGPVQKNAIRQTIIKMPPAHRDHCIHPCKMSTNCVIHYCGQCKKPRSRGYHRNHPVLPGQAIEQGICGKCKSKPRKNGGYDGTRETVRIHVRDDDRQSRGRSPPDSYRVMRYRRVSSEVERDRSNSASRTRVVICDGSSGSSSRRLSLPGAFGEARETFSHRTTMRDSGPSLSGKADRLSIQFSDDETPKTLRGGRRTAAPGEGDLGSSDDRKPQRRRISWGDAEARLASHPMPFRHGRPVNFEDHHQGSLSPSSSGRQSQRPSSPLTRPPMPSAAQKLPSSLSRGRADVVPLNPGKADKGSLSYVNRPQRPSASQDQDHRQRPGPAHNEQDQRPKPASRQRAKQSEPVAQINIRHSRSRARSSSPAEVEVIRLRSILRSPSRPRFEASVRNVKSRTDNNSGGSNTANYGGPRVQFSGESAATRRTSGITEASAAAFKHRRVPRHGADAHYSSRGDPTRDSELDDCCKVCDKLLRAAFDLPTNPRSYNPYEPPSTHIIERSTYHRSKSRNRSRSRTRRGRPLHRTSSPVEQPESRAPSARRKKVLIYSPREPSSRRLRSPPPEGQPWNREWESESSENGIVTTKKKPSVVELQKKREDGTIERWIEVREEVHDSSKALDSSETPPDFKCGDVPELEETRFESVERGRRTLREYSLN